MPQQPHLWFVCPILGADSAVWLERQISQISAFAITVICWSDLRDLSSQDRHDYRVARIDHGFSPKEKWARRWQVLRTLPFGNTLAATGAERQALEDFARDRRPDLILCHFGWTALKMLPLARALRVPLVAHYHGRDLSRSLQDRWYRRSLIRNLPHFAANVAVGSSQRRWLRDHGACPIHVIPCGAPVTHFVPEPEPDGKMRFVTIGRLQRQKGIHIAIEAFARAGRDLGGADLRIVGGGKDSAGMRTELEHLAARLGVADRVCFAGSVRPERIRDELAAASVLVHPAIDIDGETEGFGVSITEAAAMERPVIVSDSGGIPDQVIDGVTGIICPQHDVDAVSTAMIRLANDQGLRRRMGIAGRQNVIENFDTAGQVKKLESILSGVLEHGGRFPWNASARSVKHRSVSDGARGVGIPRGNPSIAR